MILMLGGLGAGLALALLAYFGIAGYYNGWSYLTHPLKTDFALSYEVARIGVEYGWAHFYDLDATHRVVRELGLDRSFDPDTPTIYPPPIGWLTAPFTLLPLAPAYYLWVVGEVLCLILAWHLAAGRRRGERLLQAGVAAASIPVVFALCLGQVIFVLVAALAGSWWLLRRGYQIPAGVALGLVVLKPHLAVLCLLYTSPSPRD